MARDAESTESGQRAIEDARRLGPVVAGGFRTLVYEADGRTTSCDHRDLATAKTHADDAASEGWGGFVSAYVLDDAFRVVHVGRHYGFTE